MRKVNLSKEESLSIMGYGGLKPELLANETLMREGQVIRSTTNQVYIHYRSLRQTNHGMFSLHYQGKSTWKLNRTLHFTESCSLFLPVSLKHPFSFSAVLFVPPVSCERWRDSDRHPSRRSGTLPLRSRFPSSWPRGGNLCQHNPTTLEHAWASMCRSVNSFRMKIHV